MPMSEINIPSHADFAENLNTSFRLHLDDAKLVEVKLVEVSELLESRSQVRFSLVFRGPLDVPLSQQSCVMSHDRLGDFEPFLVPIARDEEGFLYEAVFNLLRKPEEA